MPYSKDFRAPPCPRKGHRPLTRFGKKTAACFRSSVSPVAYDCPATVKTQAVRLACCGFGFRLSAYDRLSRLTQTYGLLMLGGVSYAFGNSLRALPCTRKGHPPLTQFDKNLRFASLE